MLRTFARIRFVALLPVVVFGQTAATTPTFDIADVHVSPRSDWVKSAPKAMQGDFLNGGRYELRRATMLDLVRAAYGVDADKVFGGPSWLDYDRFDIIAKAPPATRPETLRLMLQSLLADRFGLVVKRDSRPVDGYVLSAGKGKPKLKAAEGGGSSGCQSLAPKIGDVPYGTIQCRSVTLEAFASALRRLAGGSFTNLPVVDGTAIEGNWDIDLQYPLRVITIGAAGGAATPTGGNGVIDAVEKQLGLTLELQKVPQPVLVVESVKEQPSANPPGVAASLPALPAPELEVASIRPCDGTGPTLAPRFESGGRVTARCMPLISLITQVWGLAPFQELVGAPKWLTGGGSPSVTIAAKAPAGTYTDAQGVPDRDALNAMMRSLLIDRYKMAIHYEDRPVDAYTLVAAKPKLTRADPSNRTGCARSNPPGGPGLAIRLVCQNMTMAQLAEQIQGYSTDIFYPVIDGTGLEGAWDFTLNYNALMNVSAFLGAAAARDGLTPRASAEPSEPSGGISFVDAVEKQLGLKLEMHKRTAPVLVLDHIEEKPTEN